MAKDIVSTAELIKQYTELKSSFEQVRIIAEASVRKLLKKNSIMTMEVVSRIKERASLSRKIEKKTGKYSDIKDITDILGIRIICYFIDDVDKISEEIENLFHIDYENSVDKGKSLSPNAFGYLSVHYICSLKESAGYPDELCRLPFEIQIRTILQHVWAEIEHDLGYKSSFSIPREVRRDFSRVAGVLELADEKFSEIRENLNGYTERVQALIAKNEVKDIYLDLISLREYMENNTHMKTYIRRFEEECGVEVSIINPEHYLNLLLKLNINTLEDFNVFVDRNGAEAIALSRKELENYELDFVSSNMLLRSLVYSELKNGSYSRDEITGYLMVSMAKQKAELVTAELLGEEISG